jgi:hypothetical protein
VHQPVDEQRQLADELARPAHNRLAALQLDLHLAVRDHEQPGSLRPRLHEHIARGQLDFRDELRDVPQPDLVEVGEHRNRAQRCRGVGHGGEVRRQNLSVRPPTFNLADLWETL